MHYCFRSVFKSAVKSHMLRQHGLDLNGKKVDKQYRCTVCGFESYFSSEMKFHQAKHTGKRPHKCPICDFDTNDKGSLKKHVRGHTGEMPFTCDICGRKYTNSSTLARHRRSHTGEKPHKCSECSMAYADKKSLLAHEYKHNGSKPFKCHICMYSCIRKTNLVLHIIHTHGEDKLPENLQTKRSNKKHCPRVYRMQQDSTANVMETELIPPMVSDVQNPTDMPHIMMHFETDIFGSENQQDDSALISANECTGLVSSGDGDQLASVGAYSD